MKGIPATKGAVGIVRRASLLPLRYGISSKRIQERLLSMRTFLQRWDMVPTVPTTAIILERHPELAGALREVDVAVHGYRHVGYAELSASEQSKDLDSALQIFAQQELVVHGFRAPYLRAHRMTESLLAARGLLFDSSRAQFVLPSTHPAFADSRRLFDMRFGADEPRAAMHTSPDQLTELPVSFPDDVILIDGLRIRRKSTILSILSAMLEVIRGSHGLLVMQIHPERFGQLRDAMEDLLIQVTDDSAWKASLTEIAKWISKGGVRPRWPNGSPYAISVTGDLDAATLQDFAVRLLGE